MRNSLLYFLFLLVVANGAQFSSYAQGANELTDIQIPFKIYKTKSDSITLKELVENKVPFITPSLFSEKTNAENTYWIQADFTNQYKVLKEGSWFLKTGTHLEITVYTQEGENIVGFPYGLLNRNDATMHTDVTDGIFFSAKDLIDSQYLYFKIKSFISHDNIKSLKLRLTSAEAKKIDSRTYTWPEFINETPVYLFIGAFLFIFVFSFITYLTTKRLDFLFYSLYILCLLIYLGKSAYGINKMLSETILFSMWLHSMLQILINLFYVIFAKQYLETSLHYPKLNKAIKWIAAFLILILPIEAYLSFTLQLDAHLALMNVHRLAMSVFAVLAVIYLFIYAKNMLAYFIIIGSAAFTAGALTMLFTGDKIFMIIGCTIEVLLFGLGLNYKMKKNNEEKILLKQRVYDNQISALRAQMNPHFIFNSLSSIQHLITSNKKEAAVKYLNKFSLLMRNLLESSIEAKMVLSEEISLLRKYIELESLRFNHTFSYSITIDKAVNPDVIEVPSLIVQPFVENAILHGLLTKETGAKTLRIHFSKKDIYLVCEIEDNGIGRAASSKIKSILKRSTKSRGIDVTKKRLQIIAFSEENLIEIRDKVDIHGKATGTLVLLKIAVETK